MENLLSNNQMQVILQGIDRQIAEHQRRIMELQDAKKAFMIQHNLPPEGKGGTSTGNQNGKRRLATGIPRKYVLEAIEANNPATISEMNTYIEKAHGRKLADGTIRRIVSVLRDEKKLFPNEDGTWVLVKEPDGKDDLPF